jgi:hypothetical protein
MLRFGSKAEACDVVQGKNLFECVCTICILWYHNHNNIHVKMLFPLPMLMLAAMCCCHVPLFFLRYALYVQS